MMKKYKDNSLPLDVVWLDITYMDKYADFSVDEDAFPHMVDFAK